MEPGNFNEATEGDRWYWQASISSCKLQSEWATAWTDEWTLVFKTGDRCHDKNSPVSSPIITDRTIQNDLPYFTKDTNMSIYRLIPTVKPRNIQAENCHDYLTIDDQEIMKSGHIILLGVHIGRNLSFSS